MGSGLEPKAPLLLHSNLSHQPRPGGGLAHLARPGLFTLQKVLRDFLARAVRESSGLGVQGTLGLPCSLPPARNSGLRAVKGAGGQPTRTPAVARERRASFFSSLEGHCLGDPGSLGSPHYEPLVNQQAQTKGGFTPSSRGLAGGLALARRWAPRTWSCGSSWGAEASMGHILGPEGPGGLPRGGTRGNPPPQNVPGETRPASQGLGLWGESSQAQCAGPGRAGCWCR